METTVQRNIAPVVALILFAAAVVYGYVSPAYHTAAVLFIWIAVTIFAIVALTRALLANVPDTR